MPYLPARADAPTITIRGQIINPVREQPVEDARIVLQGGTKGIDPLLPAIITDADGRFEFQNVPVDPPLYLFASRRGLSSIRVMLRDRRDTTALKPVENLLIRLRPVEEVKFRLIDEETGKAPTESVLFSALAMEQDEEGHVQTGYESSETTPATSFTKRVVSGPNQISFTPKFYILIDAQPLPENRYLINVPATYTRQQEMVLKVRKQPGFFLTIESEDTKWGKAPVFQVFTRDEAGKDKLLGETRHRWFLPAAQWGDKMEIRVLRGEQEILPWTELTADAAQWPRVVKVP